MFEFSSFNEWSRVEPSQVKWVRVEQTWEPPDLTRVEPSQVKWVRAEQTCEPPDLNYSSSRMHVLLHILRIKKKKHCKNDIDYQNVYCEMGAYQFFLTIKITYTQYSFREWVFQHINFRKRIILMIFLIICPKIS